MDRFALHDKSRSCQNRQLRKRLSVFCALAWIIHYLYRVRKVRLHWCLATAASKHCDRLKSIVSRCPTLHSVYWPTWYAPTAILQFTILAWKELRARFLQKLPYKREIVTLPDGAQIALDWIAPSSGSSCRPNEKPICVLLHGAFQDSSSATMVDLGCSLASNGLPVVIVNRRGYGGLSLAGSLSARRLALYGFDEDLDAVLEEIWRKQIGNNVAIVGFSCGAGFAARYVGKRKALSAWSERRNASATVPRIVCTVLLDSAHCVRSCVDKVRFPFTWIMNWGLKYWYGFLHRKALKEVSPDFSEAVHRVMNPFSSLKKTYSSMQHLAGARSEEDWCDLQQPHIADIIVPSLLINSRDDPMARWENTVQNRETLSSNPNLVLAELQSGAHNCKYNFSGAASIADSMISEFVLSSWHELQSWQTEACQRGCFSDALLGA